jgi:2-oxoglutarate dioxygenase / 2-oxoglutarate/L-arginine monooxygenase/decarboxylase
MSELRTFRLPDQIDGTSSCQTLARQLIDAWRADGIFQVALDPAQCQTTAAAFEASRSFFRRPMAEKATCISDLTYAGYVASGEEVTAGEADYSEIFTVCKDLPLADPRVRAQWPCHGPVPWPDTAYRDRMNAFTAQLGAIGDRLLQLVALALELPDLETLTGLACDGWHHMRVLRFPAASASNRARGIGAHTDYGMLVIAAQDDVGGLYVRPPVAGEVRRRNWLPHESSAGMYEHQDPWTFVKPVPDVLTVFPGDILQFLTDGYLLSTPHKVRLADRERFALAYFHEPNFAATVRPLLNRFSQESIHYGTHFTNMFMRCYPDRITTQRILRDDRLATLSALRGDARAA